MRCGLAIGRPAARGAAAAVLLLVLQAGASAAERAPWHHSDSPYRAVFRVTEQPSRPEAGYALTVPVCGLGSEEGLDLYAFDQNHNSLRLMPLGKGAGNTVLALVRGSVPCSEICVYFGSKMRAPVVRQGFLQNLTLDVRTLPEGSAANWQEVRGLLERSERLGALFVDRIEQAFNPVDSSDACILVFDGYLEQRAAGKEAFMLVTDDAGYLLIDDELQIARDGRHYAGDAVRGESRKEIALTAGPHRLRLVTVDFGGDLMAVLARWVDARNKAVLPPEAFVRSGRTRCLGLEAHYRDTPLPAFRYEPVSYIGYSGAQFTEVLVVAVNGRDSVWRFDDGARFRGSSCTRILPGLASRGLSCTQDSVTARGLIQISEAPPKALSIERGEDFRRYSSLILAQNLADIDTATLRGYLTFLTYIPLNEDAIPVCEAILGQRKVPEAHRRAALTQLARAAGRRFPDKARAAYRELLKDEDGRNWQRDALEACQFALFGVRDFDWAETILKSLEKRAGKDDKTVAGLRLDLALQKGDVDAARKHLERLLAGREYGRNQRYAAVQGNALRQRFYDLLYGGFVEEAWQTLGEWSEAAPADRLTGSFSLARARLWRRLGWLDGALGELDGAILMDPLLPNLPEVELERGKVLVEAGSQDRANEVFRKVAKEYPKHPAASEARALIR